MHSYPIKAKAKYSSLVLFIMLFEVALAFYSKSEEMFLMKATEQHSHAVLVQCMFCKINFSIYLLVQSWALSRSFTREKYQAEIKRTSTWRVVRGLENNGDVSSSSDTTRISSTCKWLIMLSFMTFFNPFRSSATIAFLSFSILNSGHCNRLHGTFLTANSSLALSVCVVFFLADVNQRANMQKHMRCKHSLPVKNRRLPV